MIMRTTFISLSLALVAAVGCAGGDPIDEHSLPAEFDLDADDAPAMSGELYVEVTDDEGALLVADAVWVAVDDLDREPARCMIESGGRCETWFADVQTRDDITVWAEVCGLLFLERIEVSQMDDPYDFAAHLTVVSDTTACQPAPAAG